MRHLVYPFPGGGGRGLVFATLIIIWRALGSLTIRKPLDYVTVGYFSQGTSIVSNMVHKTEPKESAVVSLICTHKAIWKRLSSLSLVSDVGRDLPPL